MKISDIKMLLGIPLFGMIFLAVTNGMTFSGLTVFDEALISEFDWSKATLKFRDTLNLGIAALVMPFMGAIIDKYGVKTTFIFGLILLSGIMYSYSFIGSSTHMYLIHVVMAFALAAAGTLAVVIMVSQRVSDNRGAALGVALAGTSLGGYLMPKIGGYFLEEFGWRQAFRYEAIFPIVLLVVVIIFMKSSDTKTKDGKSKTEDLVELTFADALKTKQFWLLSFIGFFTYYSIMGGYLNLFLYMRELEFSTDDAIKGLGYMSLFILGAKFLSGLLTSYIDKYTLFKIQVFIMLLGAVCFSLYTTTAVWYAIPLFAIGWGGLYTLINFIIITTFGVNSAGKIGGTISFFESMGAGLGIWLSALIADQSGSYALSFKVIALFLLLGLILSFFISPVKENASTEPA